MELPLYKIIKFHSSDEMMIHSQLQALVQHLESGPLVIDLLFLDVQNQKKALQIIDEYYRNFHLWPFPYCTYILTLDTEYSTQLRLIKDLNELPKFFRSKNRTLNQKEQDWLQKIHLKQERIKHLEIDVFMKRIKKYAQGHKSLKILSDYKLFLTDLKQQIDKKG